MSESDPFTAAMRLKPETRLRLRNRCFPPVDEDTYCVWHLVAGALKMASVCSEREWLKLMFLLLRRAPLLTQTTRVVGV